MFSNIGNHPRRRFVGTWKGRVAIGASLAVAATLPLAPAQAHDTHENSQAMASIFAASVDGETAGSLGLSEADSVDNPGPHRAGLEGSLGNSTIDFGDAEVPLDEIVDWGEGGGYLSESETSGPRDTRAVTGMVGSDGAINLDSEDGSKYDPASVDLLSLFEHTGVDDMADTLVDEATLKLGVGGAEVVSQDGEIIDQDGVGGPGQYRVGQADLDLHSPAIEDAAAQIYDALGRLDQVMEEQVNKHLNTAAIDAILPNGTELDVDITSEMQDKIFKQLLAQEITTKNHVLSVDFSTGTASIHLDQLMHGENDDGPSVRPGDPTGLNSQNPNTELIDDEIYPMIGETVHDLMEEVTHIAIGEIEGALGAVTVHFNGTFEPVPGDKAEATWSANLMGDEWPEPTCTSNGGPAGTLFCGAIAGADSVLEPVVEGALIPVRDFFVKDGGHDVFYLAIDGVKTGPITIPIRQALSPALEVISKVLSVQVNSQRTAECPDGRLGALDLSAVSVAVLRDKDAGRLDFGNAGSDVSCN